GAVGWGAAVGAGPSPRPLPGGRGDQSHPLPGGDFRGRYFVSPCNARTFCLPPPGWGRVGVGGTEARRRTAAGGGRRAPPPRPSPTRGEGDHRPTAASTC